MYIIVIWNFLEILALLCNDILHVVSLVVRGTYSMNLLVEKFTIFHCVQEIIQEQITRVLLERLIVNRPHPWGLLITFIELIKVLIFVLYNLYILQALAS